jgi:hypothetical protein
VALSASHSAAKKRRAKKRLVRQTGRSASAPLLAMTGEFDRELEPSLQRLREAISPYTRFVRAERQKLERIEAELPICEDSPINTHSIS